MAFFKRCLALLFFALASAAAIYSFTFFCDDLKIAANGTSSFSSGVLSSDNTLSSMLSSFIDDDSSVPQSTTSSATPALSDGSAKGKIVSKFISPYTGSVSYNKVYVKNSTSLTIDLKSELSTLPNLRIQKNNDPQVLIVHTHTTESYMLTDKDYYAESDATRSLDNTKNVVALGSIIQSELEKMGIKAIHSDVKHDYPEYTGSYDRAAVTIKDYLKKYPSIKVVIDLHRDSMTASDGTKTKPVTTINGKKAAQVMLVVGCQDGEVTGFPNWRENFRLDIRVQQTLEVMYPGLARSMLFTPRKYNEHLTNGSMLIEVGTEANTLDEAKYSAELIGKAVGKTLNVLQK